MKKLLSQKKMADKNPFVGDVPEIIKSAKWIWPESLQWDIHNGYAQFRKEFRLPVKLARAPLFITADQSYHLYVNGRFVCRGPARGFQSHWPYDEVDLAPFLRKGKNLIAIRAHNPGFSNFQYVHQGSAGLLAAAKWGKTTLVTDESWKCRRQDGVSKDTVPTSMQLFCQEHVDARREEDGWMRPDFADQKWGYPKKFTPCVWNAMPWATLEPRGIPFLREEKVFPTQVLGLATGSSAAGYADTRDVVSLKIQENLAHRPAKPFLNFRPQSKSLLPVAPTGRGKFCSLLIDFGRTVVGNLEITVHGCRGQEIVDTLHVETIDPAQLKPHLVVATHCRMAFGNRLLCRPGKNHHVFYQIFGFRYLVLTVRDSTAPLQIRVALNQVGYPLQKTGRFFSSEKILEQIWETCAWTQQCCSLDAYVDTPWREQAQWWGDARIQAWNTFHLSGDARLFRRGIHCIASQTTPTGLTYGHSPTVAHGCVVPDFSLTWILTLWDYYWQTGSLEAFASHQQVIEGLLNYFREQTDPRTGLIRWDPRYWLFIDWEAPARPGCPAILSFWLVLALDRLAEMYAKTGLQTQATAAKKWAARLRRALLRLIDLDGRAWDGIRPDGSFTPTKSIHAQTLAIMCALQPQTDGARIQKALRPFIRGVSYEGAKPSAYWVAYVLEVLINRGFPNEAVDFIQKKWTPMAKHGTTWEVFEPAPGEWSHSHAWSAHPLYLLMQTIGGIRQLAPAWKKIRFQPTLVGKYGGAQVPTPQGLIRSRWERVGTCWQISLALPKGITAEVQLPGQKPTLLHQSRTWKIPV